MSPPTPSPRRNSQKRPPLVVLDPEVVAHRPHLGVAPPPFAVDPLRTIGRHDAVRAPTPLEALGRLIRKQRDDAPQWLGPREQPWRTLPARPIAGHVDRAGVRDRALATAQLLVLSMLQSGERLSQAELAKTAKVEQPTMAQLLARMERDGLIRREPDPVDRRSGLVILTDAARERLPTGRQVLRDGNAEMTRDLSEEEVATLVGLLRRVLDNVQAMQP